MEQTEKSHSFCLTISCDIGVSSDTWHDGYPTVIPAFTVRDEWMVVT